MCHFVVYMILNSRALLELSMKCITLCLFYFSQTCLLHCDASLRCTYGATDFKTFPFWQCFTACIFYIFFLEKRLGSYLMTTSHLLSHIKLSSGWLLSYALSVTVRSLAQIIVLDAISRGSSCMLIFWRTKQRS